MSLYVGTAGWTVPRQHLALFSTCSEVAKVSHLERYATRLRGVEINSSFRRQHRRTTWAHWAHVTPDNFRFAVKAPKAVTHIARLLNTGGALREFFDGVHSLGEKLGPVLVQLPPKLTFEEDVAQEFFSILREFHRGEVVLEPRHASWFCASADRLLRSFEVARVGADPPKGSEVTGQPGGWPGLSYWRFHGSPQTYYSEYDNRWLQAFAEKLQLLGGWSGERNTWVIFDNTVLGHASANAVWLDDVLRREDRDR